MLWLFLTIILLGSANASVRSLSVTYDDSVDVVKHIKCEPLIIKPLPESTYDNFESFLNTTYVNNTVVMKYVGAVTQVLCEKERVKLDVPLLCDSEHHFCVHNVPDEYPIFEEDTCGRPEILTGIPYDDMMSYEACLEQVSLILPITKTTTSRTTCSVNKVLASQVGGNVIVNYYGEKKGIEQCVLSIWDSAHTKFNTSKIIMGGFQTISTAVSPDLERLFFHLELCVHTSCEKEEYALTLTPYCVEPSCDYYLCWAYVRYFWCMSPIYRVVIAAVVMLLIYLSWGIIAPFFWILVAILGAFWYCVRRSKGAAYRMAYRIDSIKREITPEEAVTIDQLARYLGPPNMSPTTDPYVKASRAKTLKIRLADIKYPITAAMLLTLAGQGYAVSTSESCSVPTVFTYPPVVVSSVNNVCHIVGSTEVCSAELSMLMDVTTDTCSRITISTIEGKDVEPVFIDVCVDWIETITSLSYQYSGSEVTFSYLTSGRCPGSTGSYSCVDTKNWELKYTAASQHVGPSVGCALAGTVPICLTAKVNMGSKFDIFKAGATNTYVRISAVVRSGTGEVLECFEDSIAPPEDSEYIRDYGIFGTSVNIPFPYQNNDFAVYRSQLDRLYTVEACDVGVSCYNKFGFVQASCSYNDCYDQAFMPSTIPVTVGQTTGPKGDWISPVTPAYPLVKPTRTTVTGSTLSLKYTGGKIPVATAIRKTAVTKVPIFLNTKNMNFTVTVAKPCPEVAGDAFVFDDRLGTGQPTTVCIPLRTTCVEGAARIRLDGAALSENAACVLTVDEKDCCFGVHLSSKSNEFTLEIYGQTLVTKDLTIALREESPFVNPKPDPVDSGGGGGDDNSGGGKGVSHILSSFSRSWKGVLTWTVVAVGVVVVVAVAAVIFYYKKRAEVYEKFARA